MKRIYLKKLSIVSYTIFFFICCILSTNAQKIEKLSQAQNGRLDNYPANILDPIQWVTGNVNGQKAHYTEYMTLPYQLEIIELVPGESYSVTIGWDTKKNGTHALDFLTSYWRDNNHLTLHEGTTEEIDPTDGTVFETIGGVVRTDYLIPGPPSDAVIADYDPDVYTGSNTLAGVWAALPASDKQISIYNGTIDTLIYMHDNFTAGSTSSDYLKIEFTASGQTFTKGKSTTTAVVLAWGANIAAQALWGPGLSATGITGSPYHTFVWDCVGLDGCGNKEVQLSTDAIIVPAAPICEAFNDTVDCYGDLGSIEVHWTESAGPYDVYLDSILQVPNVTDTFTTITGVPAGIHEIYIVDNNDESSEGCFAEVVEPPYNPIVFNCASDTTLTTCLTQSEVDAAFANWIAEFSYSGGTNTVATYTVGSTVVSLDTLEAPDACGGSITIVFSATEDCLSTADCTSTFSVPTATPVAVTGPADDYNTSCEFANQAAVNAAFDAWLAQFDVTSNVCGADTVITSDWAYPDLCAGDTVMITISVTDSCTTDSYSAYFGVEAREAVAVTGPADDYNTSCEFANQAAVNAAFDAWLAQFDVTSNVCGADTVITSDWAYPDLCAGDTVMITISVTDSCTTDSYSAYFGVEAREAVAVTGPADDYNTSCEFANQAAVNAAFDAWLAQFDVTSNVCGADTVITSDWAYPDLCAGDTVMITISVTDSCTTDSYSAYFGVEAREAVAVTGPADDYNTSCEFANQAAVNAAFDAWLAQFDVTSNVCGADTVITSDWAYPDLCAGDTVMITISVTDSCTTDSYSAYFGVEAREAVAVTGPADDYNTSCEFANQAAVNAAFDAWLAQFDVTSNVCGADTVITSDWAYPDLCAGDTVMITISVTDSCTTDSYSAYFGVEAREAVAVTGPADDYNTSCEFANQAAVNAAFDAWLAQFDVTSNVCGADTVITSDWAYPDLCAGDTVMITISVTDSCTTDSYSAYFGVEAQDSIIVTCNSVLLDACMDSLSIDSAYLDWIDGFSYTGGCIVEDNITQIPDWTTLIDTFYGGTVTFTYKAWDNCTIDSVTCTFTVPPCPVNCETAYGWLDSTSSTCFIEDGFNNWGWTNNLVYEKDSSYVLPLYAGAAHCDITNGWGQVGTVTIHYSSTTGLSVTYMTDPGYAMSEVHVYVGCDKYPIMKNGKETVSPGQYTFNAGELDYSSEYTVDFPYVAADSIYVIAHAVVCDRPGTPSIDDGMSDLELACTPKSATIESFDSRLNVYPNPFSEKLTFEFTSPTDTRAVLELYNVLGQKIRTLKDGWVAKGVVNTIEYRPSDQISGLMLYRLTLDGNTQIGKVIYNKK